MIVGQNSRSNDLDVNITKPAVPSQGAAAIGEAKKAAATQRVYRATKKAAAQYERLERKAAAPTAVGRAEGGIP